MPENICGAWVLNAGVVTAEDLDPRVRRTRAQLGSAVRRLLREREPAAVSITDITTAARVSRPTFYLHYSSPDDLLAETVRRDLDLLGDVRPAPGEAGPPPVLRALVQELDQGRRLYRCLISQTTPFGQSRGEVMRYLHELILVRLAEVPADRAHAAARFAAGGTFALLAAWLAEPEEEAEVFVEKLWGLLSGVIEGLA